MKRALLATLLALTPLTSSCATTGDGDSCGDIIAAIGFGIVAIPCIVAYGAGCVVGAGTRCCESEGPSEPQEPAPSSSVELAPAAAEVRDVAY